MAKVVAATWLLSRLNRNKKVEINIINQTKPISGMYLSKTAVSFNENEDSFVEYVHIHKLKK